MSALAPFLQGFFTDRLIRQRQASPHTITGYRDTFRLLVTFAAARAGTTPSQLSLADLDATTIGAFLDHLATVRHNTASTRNGRLAAIHSLFRYAAPRAPEDAAVIQRVLAIPHRRTGRPMVAYLTTPANDALLAAPDRSTWAGRRDHALLLTGIQTGLRAAELIRLRRSGRRARPRSTPPRARQGPQRTRRPPHHPERARTARMAEGARGDDRRAGVSFPARYGAQPRRPRPAGRRRPYGHPAEPSGGADLRRVRPVVRWRSPMGPAGRTARTGTVS
jgi:integrase